MIREKILLIKERKREQERGREKKKSFTTYDHTLCTEDYIGLRTSRSNIEKKLISYNTRRDAWFTMERGRGGRGLEQQEGSWGARRGRGRTGTGGRTSFANWRVRPVGWKPGRAV